MTAGLMRKVATSNLTRAHVVVPRTSPPVLYAALKQTHRGLANIRDTDRIFSEAWFSSSVPRLSAAESGFNNTNDAKPPDERTLKLGKSEEKSSHQARHKLTHEQTAIRVLQERLPTLLASPLPMEILSPQITLHLFPSTHPHLPTVSGKIAYMAALWTAPAAWGRVPVVGNVRLVILSERMVRNGGTSTPANFRNEKLVVRWKTCGKTRGKGMGAFYRGISGSEQVDKITEFLGGDARDDEEFCGLFVFEFDEEGRIVRHTIEHAEEGGNWDKMARVISVTDWLLGKAWGKKSEQVPELALGYCETDQRDRRIRARRQDQEH